MTDVLWNRRIEEELTILAKEMDVDLRLAPLVMTWTPELTDREIFIHQQWRGSGYGVDFLVNVYTDMFG